MLKCLLVASVLAIAAALPNPLHSAPNGPVLDHCHDGDTCTFLVDGEKQRVRLMGIDAPEIDRGARCPAEQALAVKARDRLLALLNDAKAITLDRHGYDKYRRVLAYVLADGQEVGAVLVREGLARPYDGKRKRKGWC